jgi:surface protein
MRARSVGVDRGWLGSQAFYSASAFNANIGAWNTASVTNMAYVCAAFSAQAARHRRRDALGGSSMRRGPVCATGPPMRARVYADVWERACAGVRVRRYSCA